MAWRPNLSAISDLSCWLSISPLSPPILPGGRPVSADGVCKPALPPSTVRSDLSSPLDPRQNETLPLCPGACWPVTCTPTAMSFWSICSSVGGWSPGTFSVESVRFRSFEDDLLDDQRWQEKETLIADMGFRSSSNPSRSSLPRSNSTWRAVWRR